MSICVSSKIQYPNKLEYSIFCCTYSTCPGLPEFLCWTQTLQIDLGNIYKQYNIETILHRLKDIWEMFEPLLHCWHKHSQWIPAMFIANSFKLLKEELWQLKPPCNISEILCRQQTLKFPRATNQCFPRHHIHGYETQLKMFSQTDLSSSLK